ncbi:MAG: rhodanese-like domain-containing protein [Flavobacteriaceae bacterium]|nr:rhodanese-like domain-containing protein [Flavobacteriaceae bacterium]
MKLLKIFVALFIFSITCNAQADLPKLLIELNEETVPYISVDSLKLILRKVILLDAREKNEYKVSHLRGAKYVGYTNFNLKKAMKDLPEKDAKIVVYCSLGVRSEDVGEKLKNAGYTNVLNLYGGIFDWKNKDYKVYDTKEKETQKVHAFDEDWGKWLLKGEKVYD